MGSSVKSFGTVRQKIIDKKSWYSFYPKKFWYQNLSETQKGSPMNIFGTVRQKTFNRNSRYAYNTLKSFRYARKVIY